MPIRSFRILWILSLIGATSFVHAGWIDPTMTSCTYYTASPVYTDDFSVHTFPKQLGVQTLCIRQDIHPFNGLTILNCSPNPNRGWSTDSSGPVNINNCWSNCVRLDHFVDNPASCYPDEYDGSGNLITAAYCDQMQEWQITGCNQPGGAFTHKVDGAPFRAGHPLFSVCNSGSSLTPNTSLLMWKVDSKTYQYDNVSPVCERASVNSPIISFGGAFVSDAELALSASGFNAGVDDETLTYTGTIFTATPHSYRGEWTNQDIRAKGVCADEHSGCNPLDQYAISDPLTHKQLSFSTVDPNPHISTFYDEAQNSSSGTCDSTAAKLTQIDRSCLYEIREDIINDAKATNPGWLATLSVPEKNWLTAIAASPPAGDNGSFAGTIAELRRLSYTLSTFKGIPAQHDLLYNFLGSCVYTPRYNDTTDLIIPLIDRIKPTIKLTAKIGEMGSPDVLLDQENNKDSSPVPMKSYLAGSGVINIDLLDTNFSGYTPNITSAEGTKYNGISGISMYTVDIKRIKDYGDNSITPVPIFSTGYINPSPIPSSKQYNPVGAIVDPNNIGISIELNESVPDGIHVAGIYEITIQISDEAGNINSKIINFKVVPKNIVIDCITNPGAWVCKPYCEKFPTAPACQPFCTANPTDPSCILPGFIDPVLVKLEDPTDSYSSGSTILPNDIIYTLSGGTGDTPMPGAAAGSETPPYANAIDTSAYVLHLVDDYGNPVYNWNLSNFGLTSTATGIFLDEVSHTGPSALYINAGNGNYTSIPQDVKTDGNGNLFFHIQSYAPGKYTEKFSLEYKLWDRDRNPIGLNLPLIFPTNSTKMGEFFHIFTGSLELYTSNRIDLGTHNDVRLGIDTTTATPNSDITSFTVENFMESLVSFGSASANFKITGTGTYGSGFSFSPDSSYPSHLVHLSGAVSTFTPEQISTQFFDKLEVKTWPFITLKFGTLGPTAKYYLTQAKGDYGSGIVFGTGILNRIYIAGNKSSTGKEGYVDTSSSLGAVNSADLRNRIRKNVALLMRNRTTSADKAKIIGRLKYVEGNTVLSDLMIDKSEWDTLVVQGGNLIINQDFNTGATKLTDVVHKGIIVLSSDSGIGGNIYITPNVSFIGGSLFAEESVMSANSSWIPYTVSNSTRTAELDKQLVFYGGIYSKNTIGGAVRAGSDGQYILPWKGKTDILDEAVKFDLAFLRMDNKSPYTVLNGGRTEFVVILSDTRNITDPLPGWK